MTELSFPFILLVLLYICVVSDSLNSQQSTLLSIKQHWGNLPVFSTWISKTPLCSWEGIDCSEYTIDNSNSTRAVTGIYLSNADISSPIPNSICDIKTLETIDLSWNNIFGGFPKAFNGCSVLTNLDLSGNGFAGPIPNDVDKLLPASLQSLILDANNFFGNIPGSIGALSELTTLYVMDNLLNGTYPPEISNLSNLEDLRLASNPFPPNALPSEWSKMENLKILYMSSCNLVGEIPESFGGLVSLENLDLSENRLVGKFPLGLTRLSLLNILSLEDNQLSGELPFNISYSWASLTILNLARNQLSGPIPDAIGSLPNLYELYMSSNKLSGPICGAIGSWPRLKLLDLSYNNLSGKIPLLLDKEAFTESFLQNNLCTTDQFQYLNFPRCSSSPRSFFSMRLAMILVLVVTIYSVTLYLTLFAKQKTEQKKPLDKLPSWTFTSFQRLEFTEDTIISSLFEQNVIGSGGSGKVYQVQVDNSGYSVAVKKILNNHRVMNAQFLAEVEILGNIKHTNIVKLLCCISNEKTKLLVYEYMENQSLDRWLHKRRRVELEIRGEPIHILDWPTRLRIAIGAAQGLCYMHHDCRPPIIHRDIKSSNILLDSVFNAKIADFGLARIIMKQGDLHTMSSVAGTFGYLAPGKKKNTSLPSSLCVLPSFGVVLLELATGKEPNCRDETLNLAESSWRHCYEDKPIVDGLDMDVMQQSYLKQMTTVFKLGIMCTSPFPNSRPSMKDVLQVLRRSSTYEEAEDGQN